MTSKYRIPILWAIIALLITHRLHSAEPRIFQKKEGQRVAILVENPLLVPITLNFAAKGQNLFSATTLPITVVVGAGRELLLTTFGPANVNKVWHFNTTWHWQIGSMNARHDSSVVYKLPYPSGSRFPIGQGFHGKFSHHGAEEFAIDWIMPLGTTVCATRAGKVVFMKMDSDQGGNDLAKYADKANFICILHKDGTLGVYKHLKQHSATVRLGDEVKVGQGLAHSGNTGFSTAPHLHFHVAAPNDGNTFHTVPVKFHTKHEAEVEPQQGKSYEAP